MARKAAPGTATRTALEVFLEIHPAIVARIARKIAPRLASPDLPVNGSVGSSAWSCPSAPAAHVPDCAQVSIDVYVNVKAQKGSRRLARGARAGAGRLAPGFELFPCRAIFSDEKEVRHAFFSGGTGPKADPLVYRLIVSVRRQPNSLTTTVTRNLTCLTSFRFAGHAPGATIVATRPRPHKPIVRPSFPCREFSGAAHRTTVSRSAARVMAV